MMQPIILTSTTTAQWYLLVNEAEYACSVQLGEDLESYLVFLLMRFIQKPEIAQSVLALDFLKTLHREGHIRHDLLQEVGDKCLIFAGFFPEQSMRRRVSADYFINIGQSAYDVLSQLTPKNTAELYHLLSLSFKNLRTVLSAMRTTEKVTHIIDKVTDRYLDKVSH